MAIHFDGHTQTVAVVRGNTSCVSYIILHVELPKIELKLVISE